MDTTGVGGVLSRSQSSILSPKMYCEGRGRERIIQVREHEQTGERFNARDSITRPCRTTFSSHSKHFLPVMNASTHRPELEDIQILYVAVPHVTRTYPFPPNNFRPRYNTFYSPLLPDPPSRQGLPGDFFVALEHVYLKDEKGRWKVAHFSCQVSHPYIDNLFLCYDEWGPCWTPSPLPRNPRPGFCPISVSTHFYATLALHHRRQGNDLNDPIYVDHD